MDYAGSTLKVDKNLTLKVRKTHLVMEGVGMSEVKTKRHPEIETLGLLWGNREIGRHINRSPRATSHLLETGRIPARRVGGIYVTTEAALRDALLPERQKD